MRKSEWQDFMICLWWFLCYMTINYVSFMRTQELQQVEHFCSGVTHHCDYSFVAFLFNPMVPDVICMGALITDTWVIDNCVDDSWYPYERIKLGSLGLYNWSYMDLDSYIYTIETRVTHNTYKRVNFEIDGYDTEYLYAANNTVCLHKTDTKVVIVPGVVSTIDLYPKVFKPTIGDIVYMGKKKLNHFQLHEASRRTCNNHFAPYFVEGHKMLITRKQICFQTNRVTPEQCCHSQGLLLYDRKLAGVMGWSTGCSSELKVDPWVFTVLIFYRQFIRNETNLDNYLAMKNLIHDAK